MTSPTTDPSRSKADDDSNELSLEDTLAQKMRGVPVKTRTKVTGYNPYDATPPGKAKDPQAKGEAKPTDLRKLSEWIRLHREINQLKKREGESED